jgi:hypothetical protein
MTSGPKDCTAAMRADQLSCSTEVIVAARTAAAPPGRLVGDGLEEGLTKCHEAYTLGCQMTELSRPRGRARPAPELTTGTVSSPAMYRVEIFPSVHVLGARASPGEVASGTMGSPLEARGRTTRREGSPDGSNECLEYADTGAEPPGRAAARAGTVKSVMSESKGRVADDSAVKESGRGLWSLASTSSSKNPPLPPPPLGGMIEEGVMAMADTRLVGVETPLAGDLVASPSSSKNPRKAATLPGVIGAGADGSESDTKEGEGATGADAPQMESFPPISTGTGKDGFPSNTEREDRCGGAVCHARRGGTVVLLDVTTRAGEL